MRVYEAGLAFGTASSWKYVWTCDEKRIAVSQQFEQDWEGVCSRLKEIDGVVSREVQLKRAEWKFTAGKGRKIESKFEFEAGKGRKVSVPKRVVPSCYSPAFLRGERSALAAYVGMNASDFSRIEKRGNHIDYYPPQFGAIVEGLSARFGKPSYNRKSMKGWSSKCAPSMVTDPSKSTKVILSQH